MLHSGGQVSLGGGDPCQLRDIAGEGDKEGFIKVAAAAQAGGHDRGRRFPVQGHHRLVGARRRRRRRPYRYNERDMHRAWADNCYGTRQFLMDNYVRFGRISGTHRPAACRAPGGRSPSSCSATRPTSRREPSRARTRASRARARATSRRASWTSASKIVGPGAVWNGAALTRCLEFSAREKGVQFMLNRRMTEIVREQQFSGRVLGVKASYTPRFDPDTGARLESLIQTTATSTSAATPSTSARRWRSSSAAAVTAPIRSSAACSIPRSTSRRSCRADGRCSGRTARTPAASSPACGSAPISRACSRTSVTSQTFHIPPRLATRDSYTDMLPGSSDLPVPPLHRHHARARARTST